MDGRRASELTRVPDAVPLIRRQPRPLPRSWALAAGAGWPLLLVGLMAVAPQPADPHAVPTLVDSAVFLVVMVGLFGTIVAALNRQSKALVWSTGLGVVWVATTIACPLSGHHDAVGWQWYAELASSGSLLLLSLIGIRLLRTPSLRSSFEPDQVSMRVRGGFAGDPAVSTGITHDVDGDALAEGLDALVRLVDESAEIPNSLRRGTSVELRSHNLLLTTSSLRPSRRLPRPTPRTRPPRRQCSHASVLAGNQQGGWPMFGAHVRALERRLGS